MISHLGAMISVVNGVLFGRRMKGVTGTVGAACIGEGATSTGSFHEALNQAAIEKLPLVLVVANNQYAYSTPSERQFACDSLADKAAGYGVESESVDGTDLTQCLNVVGNAVASSRAGGGPRLIVARLLRLCGHGEHDDASYIDAKLKSSQLGRDCLKVAEDHLLKERWADAATLATWRSDAVQQVENTVAKVQREPTPDLFVHDWSALSTKRFVELHDEESPGPVDI